MTSIEMLKEADNLTAKSFELRDAAAKLRHEELIARPIGERLIYAAHARCPCGYGMAYDPASEGPIGRSRVRASGNARESCSDRQTGKLATSHRCLSRSTKSGARINRRQTERRRGNFWLRP